MIVATTLRSTGASANAVSAIRCTATAAFSTSARTSTVTTTKTPTQCLHRPGLTSSHFLTKNASPILSFARHDSTSTSAASSTSPSARAATSSPSKLTWNRFLELRRTRRKISVVASSISSVATAYVGLRFFIQGGYDASLAQTLGLDPILTTGLSTISFLALGWLMGPFVGNAAFNLRYSGIRKDIIAKEKEFYSRIKRHRVDPTSSSIANPVPDYYGEKIGSVADYRRWLKDQRAFNLKRGAYLGTK